jgi:hypothetical protein
LVSELDELSIDEELLSAEDEELLSAEDEDFLDEELNFSSGDSGISRFDLQEKSRETQSITTKGRA